jgi:hypothetical protein
MPSRFDHFDDTPESDDSWKGQHDWAIPAAPRKRSVIDTGPARHTFRVLRENFRSECQAARAECWLCGHDIDYSIRSGPRAWECDHMTPVSVAPELALEPSNFAASHSLCNRRRQAAAAEGVAVQSLIGEPSEDW